MVARVIKPSFFNALTAIDHRLKSIKARLRFIKPQII
jgi:hypothetical protein